MGDRSHDHDDEDHDHTRSNDRGHHHGHGHYGDETTRLERLEDPIQYRYLSAEELRTFLDPVPSWSVADLGSGTGFYTDEIAPVVERVFAVDVSERMHERYRGNGVPSNVELVTADVAAIPLGDGELDAALSLRTFHHGVSDALGEVSRLLRPGGRFVVVDWSATGAGNRDRGPDPGDCFDLATVQSMLLDRGFTVRNAHERRETFVVIATSDAE